MNYMNAQKYVAMTRIEKLLEKFDEISNKDNTEISVQQTSIVFKCNCGCTKMEHFSASREEPDKRFYVSLCKQHEKELETIKNN